MKNSIVHYFFSFLFLATSCQLIGQSYDVLGIKTFNASGLSPISENHEVKGYSSVVALDKAGKKERNYA